MQKVYYEDIFTNFYEAVLHTTFNWLHTDFSGARSFYAAITSGKSLTAKQGQYLIRILEKYKVTAKHYGVDYELVLKQASWKEPFRELDLTKRVFIEKDKNNRLWIAFKFPYQLKEKFEKEFFAKSASQNVSTWDPDRKLRLVDFYHLNLISVHEFAVNNEIELDETFLYALSEVEQIWESQEKILPHSIIDQQVTLVNATESAIEWWKNNACGDHVNDILLAKHMGYPLMLDRPHANTIEHLGSTKTNNFWTNDYKKFFDLYKSVSGKVAVLVDRTDASIAWLKDFIIQAKFHEADHGDIRVCFRSSNKDDPAINKWVKDNNLGGKVEEGKMLIFQHQPPKWLFSSNENVKIIVTNLLHPPTNVKTQDWLSQHPCVIYLGDIKASMLRNKDIVNL